MTTCFVHCHWCRQHVPEQTTTWETILVYRPGRIGLQNEQRRRCLDREACQQRSKEDNE